MSAVLASVALVASGLAVAAPTPAQAAALVKPLPTVAADPTSATAAARASGQRVEVSSQTAETSITYANPDGSFTSVQSDGPARVRQADGGWGAVDTVLVSDKTGVHPRSVVGAPLLSAGGSGPLVSLAGPDGTRASVGWPTQLSAPVLAGDTATYSNVQPNTDLVVQALSVGVEINLVLKVRPSVAPSFHLPLSTGGFTTARDTTTGAVSLRDAAGRDVISVGATRMWGAVKDSAGGPTREAPVTATMSTQAGKPQVDVSPSQAFLTDPGVTYPVTIDPSFVRQIGIDTYVRTTNPTTNYGSSGSLKIGRVTSPEIDRVVRVLRRVRDG